MLNKQQKLEWTKMDNEIRELWQENRMLLASNTNMLREIRQLKKTVKECETEFKNSLLDNQ
jgi:predicted RNase H-like nuclease (RuvC/YqgF family)